MYWLIVSFSPFSSFLRLQNEGYGAIWTTIWAQRVTNTFRPSTYSRMTMKSSVQPAVTAVPSDRFQYLTCTLEPTVAFDPGRKSKRECMTCLIPNSCITTADMESQVCQEDLNCGGIHIIGEGKVGLRKTLGPRTLKVPTREAAKRNV